MKQQGFTLIELLIVVAIIAILAAIAIPNFLQAQTRAKVSRAQADIRTIATALETYRVDFNAYPTYHYAHQPGSMGALQIGMFVGGFMESVNQPEEFDGRNPLTTPVSYMTSFPEDPFYNATGDEDFHARQYQYVNWRYAVTQVPDREAFRLSYYLFGPYRIHSLGPDGSGPTTGVVYDPTNGTISRGDIYYSQNTGYDKDVSRHYDDL